MVRTDERTHGRTDVTNGLTQYFWGALHNSPSGNHLLFLCLLRVRLRDDENLVPNFPKINNSFK